MKFLKEHLRNRFGAVHFIGVNSSPFAVYLSALICVHLRLRRFVGLTSLRVHIFTLDEQMCQSIFFR